MCWLSNLFKKKEEKPDWITQSREAVAQEEEYAASIHYAWMTAIEEGKMTEEEISIGGDYAHHEHWYLKHMESAYYTRHPEVK